MSTPNESPPPYQGNAPGNALARDEESVAQSSDALESPVHENASRELDFNQEGIYANAKVNDVGRLSITIDEKAHNLERILSPILHEAEEEGKTGSPSDQTNAEPAHIPRLNIVVQIVGSRGDVQPFIALGLALKVYGHRIRIATHPTFKSFVETNGLEFFSIGGDPAALMAFMVKNPGLFPGLDTMRSGEIGRRRKGMAEIINGCWRSCFETGDGMTSVSEQVENQDDKHFIADAIIANPPSFAHVHCAERLGIPLHLMFTMPWSPTQAFPHPLANITTSNADPQVTNFLSYALVETMTWQGLGDLVNKFRRQDLVLDPLDPIRAAGIVKSLKIPYTYAWSPNLIPKPQDWGSHISIAGFYFLPLASSYTPHQDLVDFLAKGAPPIYIGFGSIVVEDPGSLTKLIMDAVSQAGVRALVSVGWGGLGGQANNLPDNIFLLGNCPHDWLFKRVSCVVHHGGAGTTAAGIAAGVPAVIVPFFGDQPFWGDMVARAGAGPLPIPFKELTASGLAAAIKEALQPIKTEKAAQLGQSIAKENGAEDDAKSFHARLPMQNMRCSLLPDQVAVWQVPKTEIVLSAAAAVLLANEDLIKFDDLKLYQPCDYRIPQAAWEGVSGAVTATTGFLGDIVLGFSDVSVGVYNLFSKSDKKAKAVSNEEELAESNPTTSQGQLVKAEPTSKEPNLPPKPEKKPSKINKGLVRMAAATLEAPMNLTVKITEGLHNTPKIYGDTTVREPDKITGFSSGLKAAGKELGLGVYDGFSGMVTQPYKGQKEGGGAGLAKGIGKGIGGILIKPLTGVGGLFGFTFKGIYKHFQKRYGASVEAHICTARIMQGYEQLKSMTKEECEEVVSKWSANQPQRGGKD